MGSKINYVMDLREFEIYKTWREGKYRRDLERLQNDLANRGLASSSIRNAEEQWLKSEFETEVSREEAVASEFERTKGENLRMSCNQRITNYTLIAGTLIATAISLGTYYHANQISLLVNRPYLVVRTIEHSKLDPNSPDSQKRKVTDQYTLSIKNAGNLPAKINGIDLHCDQEGVMSGSLDKIGGVIGNGEEGLYIVGARSNKETRCSFIIKYDLPTAPTTSSFETKYDLYRFSDLLMLPLQVWMK